MFLSGLLRQSYPEIRKTCDLVLGSTRHVAEALVHLKEQQVLFLLVQLPVRVAAAHVTESTWRLGILHFFLDSALVRLRLRLVSVDLGTW